MEANTLLAAARLAKRHVHWIEDSCVVFNEADGPDDLEYFTLDDPADAYALWKALAKMNIEIRCLGDSGKTWVVRFNQEASIPELFDSPEKAMLSAVETLEALK